MQQRITRIQTEQANEIARLIKQYITIDQRMKGVTPVTHPVISSQQKKSFRETIKIMDNLNLQDAASEMDVEDKRNTPSR